MERKVRTGRLKKGMYVSNLDRPWLDTPFLLQGFYINDEEEITALDNYCDYVFIDTDRGISADMYWDEYFNLPSNEFFEQFLKKRVRQTEYVDKHEVSEELPLARPVFEQSMEGFVSMMTAIKAGSKLDMKKIKALVMPLIESALRNPDALVWLSQLREQDEYLYSQSVDHCVLAIVFGRFAGLPKDDIYHLAVGVLLFDIGKLNISENLLLKRTLLTEEEFKKVKKHVDDGYDYLGKFNGLHEDSINTVLTHHERHDGSGYPGKLAGLQIPVFGRIAGMIDCYQAMISRRPYSEPIGAHDALQKLYRWRNLYFQTELVEQFLKGMGVYPTGSLLEMKSGEVGIVLSQNRGRHNKPKVMLLLDKKKQDLQDYPVIDLLAAESENESGQLSVLRGLDPGAYGIELSELYL